MKILKKVWGIGLVLVLLVSMLLTTVPVSAGTLEWSGVTIPDDTGATFQLTGLAGGNPTNLKVAPNGDLFILDTVANKVYKSVTGGVTWTASVAVAATGTLVDLVVSPSYATDSTLFVLDAGTGLNARVFVSSNGGITFAPLGGLIAGVGTSMAVAPTYNAGGEVMVGTQIAAPATYGEVYIWGRNGTLDWQASGIGNDTGANLVVTTGLTGGTFSVAGTFTITYTNAAGTAARTGTATVNQDGGGLVAVDTSVPVVLQVAGEGIQSVQNIALGTSDVGAGVVVVKSATMGQTMGTFTVGGAFAAGAASGKDVTKVAYSPNFPIDSTRLAVGSNAAAGTQLHTLIGGNAFWNSGTITVASTISALIGGTGDGASSIVSSTIAFPSDYNATLITSRNVFVGVISAGAVDNVYRVATGSAAASVALNPLALFGITDHEITSIAYNGTYAAGTLFAGQSAGTWVMSTSNANAPVGVTSWLPGVTVPSGANTTYIALANDYASSNKMYAATSGADAAVSVSNDSGVYFYQAGFIKSVIITIDDIAAVSSTEMWMVTGDGAATTESLWRTTDSGATWYRYGTLATTTNGIVRLSPNYATDNTLLFANAGGTDILMSTNAGLSWTARTSPAALSDIVMKDQYTWYVGAVAATAVHNTVNGGWTWGIPKAIGAGFVSDLAIDLATGHILASNTVGQIYLYTGVQFVQVGTAAIVATPFDVAFDVNYADNKTIYAAQTGTNDGIYRWVVDGGYIDWLRIKANSAPAAQNVAFMIAPDGTMYATSNGAGIGMARSINPTAGTATAFRGAFTPAVSAALAANSTLGGMTMAADSNVIYAIDTTNIRIVTYTDTLTQAIPTVTGPAEGAKLVRTNVLVTFDLVPGALSHDVQWSTRADFIGAAAAVNVGWPNNSQLLAIGAGLDGVTIYYRVRVSTPVPGPWSAARTVETQLIVAPPNAPVPQGAIEGGTNNGGWDASLNPTFQWQTVGGATNYEFQLSKNNTFTDLVVDATGGNAFGNVTAFVLTDQTLSYDTSYFWRVRAISATSTTEWSPAIAFTTMAEAVEQPTSTGPAVTQPAVTQTSIVVTQPVTTQVVEETAPAYIWAIIVVGAILVIAVVVLIVRTRRSV